MISGSDQTNCRPRTPLFHVQPSGWPFIVQNRIGRPSFLASCTAGQKTFRQLISLNFCSSAFGLMKVR